MREVKEFVSGSAEPTFQYTFDEYDDRGNRTKRTRTSDGAVTVYTWDHRHRLVRVAEGGTLVEYGYDASNQWVAKQVTAGTGTPSLSYYIYDSGQIVLDFDGTELSDLDHRYLWGPNVDQLLAAETVTSTSVDGDVLYPLTDNLGSVRDLFDPSSGAVEKHFYYDSFGNLTTVNDYNTPTESLLFGYTGRMFDSNTGLQNNLNRWYDPAVGRWISEDHIGFEAGDSNLYRYVGNSPTNYVDPDGHFKIDTRQKTSTARRQSRSPIGGKGTRHIIGHDYKFEWTDASDGNMFLQKVTLWGSFTIYDGCGRSHSVHFTEEYLEAWIAGTRMFRTNPLRNSRLDMHKAGPSKAAAFMETVMGMDFKLGPENTVNMEFRDGTTLEVEAWSFNLEADFEVYNVDNSNVAMPAFPTFYGTGAHEFRITNVNTVFDTGNRAGFENMLHPSKGTGKIPNVAWPPANSNGRAHKSHDVWRFRWESGQRYRTGTYSGGYSAR